MVEQVPQSQKTGCLPALPWSMEDKVLLLINKREYFRQVKT